SAEQQIDRTSEAVADAIDSDPDEVHFSQITPEKVDRAEEVIDPEMQAGGDGDGDLVGATVTHSRFGIGQVESVSGSGDNARLTIDFPTHGEETVVRKFVKIVG
ncbi:MAG: hypothetical protein ABEN55_18075, partial [Bradymonadaceae bacterium]